MIAIDPCRILGRGAVVLLFVLLLAGCTETLLSNRDEIRIDTGDLGEIMPGAREWLTHRQALDHCRKTDREPELFDIKGRVMIYRCVSPE